MLDIFSHATVTKGTKYTYQFINHVNHLFVSTISFWRDSSFPTIINYRGPCEKPTDPGFLLRETCILALELLWGIPNRLLEDYRDKGIAINFKIFNF